jgi:ribosomal protein S18 acetylase RimI-like enzyme
MTGEQIQIRVADVADAATIAQLLHDFNTEFSEPSPGVERLTETVAGLVGRREATVLLAGEGSAGLAVLRLRASVWSPGPEAHLQELYVVPSLRGRGIGRALLEATVAAARAANASWIDLNTSTDDEAAIRLYESAGFSNREGGADGPSMLFYERQL